MKKIILIVLSVFIMSCNLCGESEFAHMPTYAKTLVYTDGDMYIYRVTDFDGYETEIYYIDNNNNVVEIDYIVVSPNSL